MAESSKYKARTPVLTQLKTMETMQTHQLAAKKQIQNPLAEAHKQLAAAEQLSGENHIFNFDRTSRLNYVVDMTKDLLAHLCDAAE